MTITTHNAWFGSADDLNAAGITISQSNLREPMGEEHECTK